MRKEITEVLVGVGEIFLEQGLATSFEIVNAHDVHAYYRLAANQKIAVNTQGYPGLSNHNAGRFYARAMEYENLLEIRRKGGISSGNEHDAVIKSFSNFDSGIYLPYSSTELVRQLMIGLGNLPQIFGRES